MEDKVISSKDAKVNSSREIKIYTLCYNEETLIPIMIKHYNRMFPGCVITIIDNESTDKSVEIARSLGAHIQTICSNNENNCDIFLEIRNNVWKEARNSQDSSNKSTWVIICDMDELLCMNYLDLEEEENKGCTIISTTGYQILGESNDDTLSDIDLFELNKAYTDVMYSKNICFRADKIDEINYTYGAHECKPQGCVQFSTKKYSLYHMNFLGLPWLIKKYVKAYNRSHRNRRIHRSTHYSNDINKITRTYNENLKKGSDVNSLSFYQSIF